MKTRHLSFPPFPRSKPAHEASLQPKSFTIV
jgi:hypothetical protein